ncbi:hypothetical protein AWC38_SpisGene14228 [Stylophora pistillata]|uniref:Uncharacterized protein n=1 Tax=Stylophora pistillata TaxID=50429 RepID=A0A2B4RSA1_STYPI|nr:hypothetical protein AWC38_SpisGene14228 [Stylophora pistillata]
MSYSNGLLNSRSSDCSETSTGSRGLPGVGFKLTDDGDYDMENKRLKNVKNPTDPQDVCTKVYVDQYIHSDGSKTISSDFDMGNNKIINLGAGVDVKDAVSVSQLNTKLDKTQFNTAKNAFQAQFDQLDNDKADVADLNAYFNIQNDNTIFGTPINNDDAINKIYVDDEIAKIPHSGTDLTDYLNKKQGGSIEKALNFTSVHGADRQITGLSDQPLNGTAGVNDNKLQAELSKKADSTTVINGLYGKADKTAVMLLNGNQSMIGDMNLMVFYGVPVFIVSSVKELRKTCEGREAGRSRMEEKEEESDVDDDFIIVQQPQYKRIENGETQKIRKEDINLCSWLAALIRVELLKAQPQDPCPALDPSSSSRNREPRAHHGRRSYL